MMTTENTVKLLKFTLEEITSIDNYSDLYQHLLALDVLKTSGYIYNIKSDKSLLVSYTESMVSNNNEEIKRILSGNYTYVYNFYSSVTGNTLPTNVNQWLESLGSSIHVLNTFLNDVTVLLYLDHKETQRFQADEIVTTLLRVILDHLAKKLKEVNDIINN